VRNGAGVFTVELKSGRVGKISKPEYYDVVFPLQSPEQSMTARDAWPAAKPG